VKTTNRCRVKVCKWHDPLVKFGCSRVIRSSWTREDLRSCPLRKKSVRLEHRKNMRRNYLRYQKNGYNRKYYKRWREKNNSVMHVYFTLRRLKPSPQDVIKDRRLFTGNTLEYIIEQTVDYCFGHTWKTLKPLLKK